MEADLSFPHIIDGLSAPIATTTADGRVDLANKQFLDYLGMSLEELKDWETSGAVHPDDLPRVVAAWRRSLERGEPYEAEQRVRHADGSYQWVHLRGLPIRDTQGRILSWCILLTDIAERKCTEALLDGEKRLLEMVASGYPVEDVLDAMCSIVDAIVSNSACSILLIDRNGKFRYGAGPTLPAGYDGTVNGAPVLCEAGPCGTAAALKEQVIVHDLDSDPRWIGLEWRTLVLEHGLRSVCSTPIVSLTGKVLGTFAIYQREPKPPTALLRDLIARFTHVASIAIERAISESDLQERERELLMIVDTIPGLVATLTPRGEVETVNKQVIAYCGRTLEELKHWGTSDTVHPEDLPRASQIESDSIASGNQYEIVERIRRFDGVYRWFQVRGFPLQGSDGGIVRWYVLLTDIEDLMRVEAELAGSERNLSQIINTIPTHIYVLNTEGFVQHVNQAVMDYTGLTMDDVQQEDYRDRVIHPEDFKRVRAGRAASLRGTAQFSTEQRVLGKDGQYRWFLVRYKPLLDEHGRIDRWYVAAFDIEDRKRAEEALAGSERNLSLMINAIPTFIQVSHADGTVLSVNQTVLDYYGVSIADILKEDFRSRVYHPDDVERLREERKEALKRPVPFEYEQRALGKDGKYRWFLVRYNPLLDEQGRIDRWYVAAFDIEARKRAEAELRALKDRLYEENQVLRDEVDRTSMFEEIVGTSSALQPILARIAKVARTDSTVLITGETGTGKELVARAIHRRSPRSGRPFVSINCAAVPRELIASELFGHEKGAFTGATQRRLGRFELAHGGTIFLDEVGELSMETQVALLRVLQEREFERVGGSTSIRVDVRVIAATNRDLQASIGGGLFRSDLFYRLNVFPIAVPALRERTDDIPVLVEYFIDRYARKAGKTIRRINKRTLDHLRSYPWPGNVRELQNVIERSVIVCDTEEFTVDESWLSARPTIEGPLALTGTLAAHEKAVVEDALRASGGRVFGPSGAAARLGIPRSTLESKIRALKINKEHFRARAANS